jgi:putative ABC transport system ATP-binding protein
MMGLKVSDEAGKGRTRSTDVILRAERLTRLVEDRAIVEDVSFRVGRGEVVAIVGPSGSGKSSLLRLLNRLDEPTSGTVFVEGNDYRGIPPRELRRRLGMVFQRPFLFPGNVGANLRFGPIAHGETLADDSVAQLLEDVGLAGYASREVSRLSGGEAQRVSLTRTLANRPEVLLLDEPTSALDPDAQRGIEELIGGIIARGSLTCLIVTHDRPQAERMAGRALVLEAGRLVNSGGVKEG